jgi:hypothetical protein
MSLPAPAEESPFELVRTLERSGALTPTRLDLSSRPDLSVESCTALASFFGHLNNSSRWWIADLHEFVEAVHGEYVAQIMDATGLAAQTIENIISVGRRVPPNRRRQGVKFSLHAEVASLPPNDQRRWLKVAEDEGLTKIELRARIKPELPPAGKQSIVCPHCGGVIA